MNWTTLTSETPFLDEARKSMTSLSRHHSLEAPSVDPRVHVPAADKINLILRMPVPTRQRGRLE